MNESRKTTTKPPLGITPRYIHDESRMSKIFEAMIRYSVHHTLIPIEWIHELQGLIESLINHGLTVPLRQNSINSLDQSEVAALDFSINSSLTRVELEDEITRLKVEIYSKSEIIMDRNEDISELSKIRDEIRESLILSRAEIILTNEDNEKLRGQILKLEEARKAENEFFRVAIEERDRENVRLAEETAKLREQLRPKAGTVMADSTGNVIGVYAGSNDVIAKTLKDAVKYEKYVLECGKWNQKPIQPSFSRQESQQSQETPAECGERESNELLESARESVAASEPFHFVTCDLPEVETEQEADPQAVAEPPHDSSLQDTIDLDRSIGERLAADSERIVKQYYPDAFLECSASGHWHITRELSGFDRNLRLSDLICTSPAEAWNSAASSIPVSEAEKFVRQSDPFVSLSRQGTKKWSVKVEAGIFPPRDTPNEAWEIAAKSIRLYGNGNVASEEKESEKEPEEVTA